MAIRMVEKMAWLVNEWIDQLPLAERLAARAAAVKGWPDLFIGGKGLPTATRRDGDELAALVGRSIDWAMSTGHAPWASLAFLGFMQALRDKTRAEEYEWSRNALALLDECIADLNSKVEF